MNGSHGTKEHLLAIATKLFAQKNYESVSTKEICETAGANIAAIHYHFGSKEQLYRAIVKGFGDKMLPRLLPTLESPSSTEELRVRLQLFLEQALDLIHEEPCVTRIIVRDGHLLSTLCADIFGETFQKLNERMVAFFSEAQHKRILSKNVSPKIMGEIVDSILISKIFEDRSIQKKLYDYDSSVRGERKKWIASLLSMLMNGMVGRGAP